MLISKEKNFISAVVYIHNNHGEIYNFLNIINSQLKENFEQYEIICVNDDSTDNGEEEIKRFASNIESGIISILNMSFYQGVELSMNAGVDLAIGDFVYEFDSLEDIYSEHLIMDAYMHSLKGFDIVSVSPKKNSSLLSSTFYFLFNHVASMQYNIRTDSFRILSRRAINRIHSLSKTVPYRKAVYANCGLKQDTIIYENSPKKGSRKQNHNLFMTGIDSIILFTDFSYKCSFFLSAFMTAMTLAMGIYTVLIYLNGKPVEGWTTTMLFLVLGFSGMFIILTMLIKYASIILKLNFNRQKYIVESIEKINN